jgi:hypothetical protein
MRKFFLAAAIVGTVLPLTFFAQFLAANGVDGSAFFRQLFQNHVSSLFAMDLIVSAIVLWVFVFVEGRKRGMGHLWIYVVCTLLVGVSLALPLFLLIREGKLQANDQRRTLTPDR